MNIYVAGKWEDRERIKILMRYVKGYRHHITCDWTGHEPPTIDKQYVLEQYALEDLEGIEEADWYVGVFLDNYQYKGALVELGFAIANYKQIHLIGHAIDSCLFTHYPLIYRHETISDFLQHLRNIRKD